MERDDAWWQCGWDDVVMIHFACDPATLRVPFALDLWEGQAWVSLVAFTLSGLRPVGLSGPRYSPLRFLNLRTYRRERGEPAIQFLAEWLSCSRLARLGRWTYALPMYGARLQLEHADGQALSGAVAAAGGGLRYRGALDPAAAPERERDRFLLERYLALGQRGRRTRAFRVCHPPWVASPAAVALERRDLLDRHCPALRGLAPAAAHWSAGFPDARMGGPGDPPRG